MALRGRGVRRNRAQFEDVEPEEEPVGPMHRYIDELGEGEVNYWNGENPGNWRNMRLIGL